MRATGRRLGSALAGLLDDAMAMSRPGSDLLERSPTLILNADYTPLSIAPLSLLNWKDALRSVYLQKVTVVSNYENLFLRSVTMVLPLPSVVALKQYQTIPSRKPVLTRRNVLLRDSFRCSYCGVSYASDKLTLDHITPRSKGGLTEWTNICACCHACNQRKGSTSLKDLRRIGMRLMHPPKVPSIYDLQLRRKGSALVLEDDDASNTPNLAANSGFHPHWKAFTFCE